MAIDRAEEGDAYRPVRGASSLDGGADGDGDGLADGGGLAVLADPERRAAIHRLHQAIVDHTYGVARDAWARAFPGLRAAWERHVEKYPEGARETARTQPDGSWVGDGNRRLNPEQNSEASTACKDIHDECRQVILPAMERIEAADADRKLTGLEHMLKGEDRLKEKIADYLRAPGVTVREALGMVPDAVRFTLSYGIEGYADGVRADVDRFKADGFELIKLKNVWSGDQYKGINSQWCRPETGLRFEVQFHTLESLEAKELTHKAYERIRGSASAAERRELEDFQSQVNSLIVAPPGTAGIEDFPEKKDG